MTNVIRMRGGSAATIRCAAPALAIVVWAVEALAQPLLPSPISGPSPIRLGQGEVTVVQYQAAGVAEIRGRFDGRPVEFFSTAQPGTWHALLGADLDE